MNYIFNESDMNMFKTFLTEFEYKSLFANLVNKGASISISLNEKEVERLIDQISNKFMEIGLLSNSEPSPAGLQLESLIDKLNS